MRRALSALSFVSLLTLAPACDSEDTVGDDFRAAFDINVQMMTAAEGGSDDGTIVWEIVEAEVYEGPASAGNLLLYIEDNRIYDVTGTETCHIDGPDLYSSATGSDVLFTVSGDQVFEGNVSTGGNLGKLLFEYQGADIFLGDAIHDIKVMTTNAELELQSDGRKLLMAALITGECGSAGLPGYSL